MRYNTRKSRKKAKNFRILYTVLTTVVIAGIFTVAVMSAQKQNAAASSSKAVLSSKGNASHKENSQGKISSSGKTGAFSKTVSSKGVSSKPSSGKTTSPKAKAASPNILKGCVFMGDSVTEGMIYYSKFDKATIVSSVGASAYRALTSHKEEINGKRSNVGYIPDFAAAAHPTKVYMMFGTNDLNWGKQMTISYYISNYGKLINAVHARCPKAKIYIQSILPIGRSVENSTYHFDNARVNSFNVALKQMCRQRGLKYLDVASVIKGPDGCLPVNQSDDGLHLRAALYTKWFNYIAANS